MEKILPLSVNNVSKVAEIDDMCFDSEKWSENLFREEIGDESKYYAVFYCEESVVGFGSYSQILDEGHILNIAVLPEYRRRGIASKILSDLIRDGKSKGINAFTLEVRMGNAPARTLYERFGFELAGVRKKFYPDKEDAGIYWLYV